MNAAAGSRPDAQVSDVLDGIAEAADEGDLDELATAEIEQPVDMTEAVAGDVSSPR